MATEEEILAVENELGRKTKAPFEIAVIDLFDRPVVIKNAPLCYDGEPMPTMYWLVGKPEIAAVGHIESSGGVNQAEQEIDPDLLTKTHEEYARERDSQIPDHFQDARPSGGVGGTRTGVKCLHAHLAYYLAGGRDPVGQWTVDRLRELGEWADDYRRCL